MGEEENEKPESDEEFDEWVKRNWGKYPPFHRDELEEKWKEQMKAEKEEEEEEEKSINDPTSTLGPSRDRKARVQAGSRRNQSIPIDVYDRSSEHESGARQDSKRRVTPTLSLTLTPMYQDLRGQAYQVPGSRIVFNLDAIGATTN